MTNKTPSQMDSYNGDRSAKAHFHVPGTPTGLSMGVSINELAEELGGERIGEIKFSSNTMSVDWKLADGSTVQAASYPTFAALPHVNRISSDGIVGITNKTQNDLIGLPSSSSARHMKVIKHDEKLYVIPTNDEMGCYINAVADISAEVATTVDFKNSYGAYFAGSSSTYAKDCLHATDGTTHLFIDKYNSSTDVVLACATTDFVNFDQHPIMSDSSTLSPSVAWFDASDGCFWIAIQKSVTTYFYKSADSGQTWTHEGYSSSMSNPYSTGALSDGSRWFSDSTRVYVFPNWLTNKINYVEYYFNQVSNYGRVAQKNDELGLFDNADSSVGRMTWKGDIEYKTISELVGGVNDLLVIGDSVIIAADNGNLYSTTDYINLNHIGSIEEASLSTKDIFLSYLGDDRVAAIYRDSTYSRMVQFDLVRSPQDLVKLPLCDAPTGTQAYIKVS